MNATQVTAMVNEKLEGKTFEQLVEIYEGFVLGGINNLDIENAIMDKMIEVDEGKFMTWAEEIEEN